MNGWWAGAASDVFPVPLGTPMAGYMARTGPADSVRDELAVSALLLDQAGRRLAIVSADIAAVDAELVEEISTVAGLERGELLLCASHTHSGPAGVVRRMHPADDDRLDPELRRSFVALCAGLIAEAIAAREPVELLAGRTEVTGLAANRNDPNGPYDPAVTVLAARDLAGELAAIVVHAVCHPTILGAESRTISAEFPGAMRREIGRSLAAGKRTPVALFVNGAAGDVSTRYTRSGQNGAEVERVGAGVAAAALVALASAQPIAHSLRYDRATVLASVRPLDGIDHDQRSLAHAPASTAAERIAVTRAQGAALLAQLAAAGPDAIRSTFDLEAWALGELTIVAVPGELFASLGARIASGSDALTLVAGYANGYVGYLADAAAYEAGTYEALASPFAPGAGEQVAEIGRDLALNVRREPRA